MSKSVILMAGLPGTGKSTIAKKLRDNLMFYDLYSLLETRRIFGHRVYRQKSNVNVMVELYRQAEESLAMGKGVVIDSTYTTVLGRLNAYNLAQKYDRHILVLECDCSEREAKRRMKLRPKNTGLIQEPRSPRVYDKLAQRWEDISIDLELGNLRLSYLRFNSETNLLEKVRVGPQEQNLVNNIESILASNPIL